MGSMNDVALKPQLLRLILREYIPDDKHPFNDPSDLSYAVSAVRTHRLLSESASPSSDQNLVESWKSAVDAWVNRSLTLVASNEPDKIWAGLCLIGVTCQECGADRFSSSSSVWFSKMLLQIEVPAGSHLVKIASCCSMSDLFTRLGYFPSAKKDGYSLATKLIEPVLKLINEDSSVAVWEEAICLLCTIINVFPSSVNRSYQNVEAAIVSKLMSGKCSDDMLQKLSHCLVLLPKSRGDEDNWLLMMQKILLSINTQLNDVLLGLEEEPRGNEVMRVLLPPGNDQPPPLGDQAVFEETSNQAMKRPERFLMSRVSALVHCCCSLLTNPYPVQVSIPVCALVALARRILSVDGSFSQASYSFMTAMKQEFICSELPKLHLHALDLILAITKGIRSQLLPHAAGIIRLLTEYFTTCSFPELRVKVYSIIKVLMISMGTGAAIHLTQVVIDNAFVDLDEKDSERSGACLKACATLAQSSRRKRKHVEIAQSTENQSDRDGPEVEAVRNSASISVKVAALETLEALLAVSGAFRSESWRSNIDHLLITVAANACKGGWAKEEGIFLAGGSTPVWADFQLTAFRALRASLLSPGRVRPPGLAQGLELFARGMQERGTRLAEFCADAIMALEVLIHPRALPLLDSQFALDTPSDDQRFPDYLFFGRQRPKTRLQIGRPERGPSEPESEEDELYERWTQNSEEMEIPVDELGKKGLSEPPLEPSLQEPPKNNTFGKDIVGESKIAASSASGNQRTMMGKDVTTTEFHQSGETISQSKENVDTGGEAVHAVAGSGSDIQSTIAVHETAPLETMGIETTSSVDASATKSRVISMAHEIGGPAVANDSAKKDESAAILDKISATLSNSVKPVDHLMDSDNESIPDIVDGDPDSD